MDQERNNLRRLEKTFQAFDQVRMDESKKNESKRRLEDQVKHES